MSQLTVNVTWPTALPLPSINYSAEPRNSTISSKDLTSSIARRSRFERSYGSLSVQWTFTVAQWSAFRTFVATDLHSGTAAFKIELRYPNNNTLTEWCARLEGDVDASYDDGIWKVSSTLDLVNPVYF